MAPTPTAASPPASAPVGNDPRFDLVYDWEGHRRFVAGTSVIIHCHHYNARIQNTIESARGFDGKGMFREVAQDAFQRALERAVRSDEAPTARLRVAERLYAELGYGLLELGAEDAKVLTAPVSHFVEGWRAGFPRTQRAVCTLTEGFAQAAIHVATGRSVGVRETACMLEGAPECRFEVSSAPPRSAPSVAPFIPPVSSPPPFVHSPRIDEDAIIRAVVGMSIRGDDEGLIPAFNVYLANTPAEFYSEVCVRFVDEMEALKQRRVAVRLLTFDAETCGLNTFRGIRASAEWDALVAPMVTDLSDELFGLIAISNALGWGNWHPTQHEAGASVRFWSANGYEACGNRSRGERQKPGCFMLTGVAAGLMELVYGEGAVIERFGQFASRELCCVSCGSSGCEFEAIRT